MLHNPEYVFSLDPTTKLPLSFTETARMESKFLVEEYMLLTNILVAEFLKENCQDKTLLRVHADITDKKKE